MITLFTCLACGRKQERFRRDKIFCNRKCKDYYAGKTPEKRKYFREHNRLKNQLSLGYKESLGYKGEREAIKLLKGSFKNYSNGVLADLTWKDKRIEVKTANKNKKNLWHFFTKKQLGKTDYFMFFCKENGLTKHIFFVPSSLIKSSDIMITEKNIGYYLNYQFEGGVKNI
jgi:hypothetical protein